MAVMIPETALIHAGTYGREVVGSSGSGHVSFHPLGRDLVAGLPPARQRLKPILIGLILGGKLAGPSCAECPPSPRMLLPRLQLASRAG
jgi:hypothetical protein